MALWRQFLAHELLGCAHHMLGGGVRPPQRLHHMLGGGSRPPQRLHHMLGGGWGVSRSAPPSLEAMCACSNRSSHVVRQVIGKELRGYMTVMERATPLPRGGGGTWTPPCSHAATVNRSASPPTRGGHRHQEHLRRYPRGSRGREAGVRGGARCGQRAAWLGESTGRGREERRGGGEAGGVQGDTAAASAAAAVSFLDLRRELRDGRRRDGRPARVHWGIRHSCAHGI